MSVLTLYIVQWRACWRLAVWNRRTIAVSLTYMRHTRRISGRHGVRLSRSESRASTFRGKVPPVLHTSHPGLESARVINIYQTSILFVG